MINYNWIKVSIKVHSYKYKRFFLEKRRVIVNKLVERVETSDSKEKHHEVTVVVVDVDYFIIVLFMTSVVDPEFVDILLAK